MSQRPPVAPSPAPLARAAEGDKLPAAFALLVDCAVCGATHAPGTDDDPGCEHGASL